MNKLLLLSVLISTPAISEQAPTFSCSFDHQKVTVEGYKNLLLASPIKLTIKNWATGSREFRSGYFSDKWEYRVNSSMENVVLIGDQDEILIIHDVCKYNKHDSNCRREGMYKSQIITYSQTGADAISLNGTCYLSGRVSIKQKPTI